MRVEELAKLYFKSHEFTQLSRNSKINYESAWNNLATMRIKGELFGNMKVAAVTPKIVEKIKDDFLSERGTAALKLAFAVMNNMWSRAYRMELTPINPWTAPRIKQKIVRSVTWTPQQIIRFTYIARHIKKWDDVALIFLLCYETSQRPVDIINLKKSQIEGSTIQIYQQKTGTFVNLLIPPYLEEAVKASMDNKTEYAIINKHTGSPRNYPSFAKCFELICASDPLFKGLQLRDLRRTAITEACDVGATDWETQSMSGHRSPQSAIPYKVRSNEAAHEAQRKRWEARPPIDIWSDPTKPD